LKLNYYLDMKPEVKEALLANFKLAKETLEAQGLGTVHNLIKMVQIIQTQERIEELKDLNDHLEGFKKILKDKE